MTRTATPQRFDPLRAVKDSPARTDGTQTRVKIEETFSRLSRKEWSSMRAWQKRLP